MNRSGDLCVLPSGPNLPIAGRCTYRRVLQLALSATLLGLALLLSGCHIMNLQQPRFAQPGAAIRVIVHTESSPSMGDTIDAEPVFGVRLPTDWSVQSSPTYWGSGNNGGTLTYSATLASELNTMYGGTWWAGIGPLATWPLPVVTATGIITLQSSTVPGDYQLDYISGYHDGWGNEWDELVPAHITLTSQKPVHAGAVASVRDYASAGTAPSVSLQKARDLDLNVVYHYLGWDTIEHRPGHYDWDTLEDILAQVEAYDQQVVLRIYNPPPWRTPDGAPAGAPPANNDDLREFMRRLTAYVKDGDLDFYARPERVAGYVIWNEPNIKAQWGGQAPDPAAYMAMLRAAYTGAKEGDRAAVIISAPLAPTADKAGEAINDLTYLAQLYDHGLADYTDYVGMNGLGFQYDPDHDNGAADYNFMRLKYLHDVMLAKGDTAHQVWALEVGWLRDSNYDMGTFEPFKVSAAQQSQYVTRAFEKARTEWPWLDLMAIWNVDFNRYYPPTSNFYWYSIVPTWPDLNPLPSISSLSPTSARPGGPAFNLTIYGTNFMPGAVVHWNGSSRVTTFVSSTQLRAAISAADIALPGTAQVTVVNPAPGGGPSPPSSFIISDTTKPWTFMLYLDGDNNLYSYMERAIAALEAQPENPNVNIVVLWDGDRNQDTWRFLVQPGGNYSLGVNRWFLGELNMGNPQTLSDFVTWTRDHYPAQHYYLAIADHGRGTQGVAWDGWDGVHTGDWAHGDNLSNAELRAALNLATNSGQWQIDVLHYDVCLMGLLENAYQVKEYADYLVVSQNLGWSVFAYQDYADLDAAGLAQGSAPYEFAALAARVSAATTPRQLAVDVTDAYFNHPSLADDHPRTISALDLGQVVAVHQAVDNLAAALRANLDSIKGYIQNARNVTQKFDSRDYWKITQEDEYLDLYHLAQRLKQYISNSQVQAAAQGVMDAIDGGFVIAEQHESGVCLDNKEFYWDLDNAHGISIYFPPRPGSDDYNGYITHQLFSYTTESQWDDFLVDYFSVMGLPPDEGGDPGLPPMLPPGIKVYLPLILKSN
jgi:hypothetical protein